MILASSSGELGVNVGDPLTWGSKQFNSTQPAGCHEQSAFRGGVLGGCSLGTKPWLI